MLPLPSGRRSPAASRSAGERDRSRRSRRLRAEPNSPPEPTPHRWSSTDAASDFASLLNNQTWNNAGFQIYVLGDGKGTDNALNGQGYYNWRNPQMFGWDQSVFLSTTAETANFGGGNVNGQVMLLTIAVPEPSTLALVACGGLALAAVSRRRGWRRPSRCGTPGPPNSNRAV